MLKFIIAVGWLELELTGKPPYLTFWKWNHTSLVACRVQSGAQTLNPFNRNWSLKRQNLLLWKVDIAATVLKESEREFGEVEGSFLSSNKVSQISINTSTKLTPSKESLENTSFVNNDFETTTTAATATIFHNLLSIASHASCKH